MSAKTTLPVARARWTATSDPSTLNNQNMIDESVDGSDILDVLGEEGWEDVEPDNEKVRFKSLYDDQTFEDVHSMLQHDLDTHRLDFKAVRDEFELNFIDSVRLVNYIRGHAKNGNHNPDLSSKDLFSDDKYLQPVLEDDALLFSLDDLGSPPEEEGVISYAERVQAFRNLHTTNEEEVQKILINIPDKLVDKHVTSMAQISGNDNVAKPEEVAIIERIAKSLEGLVENVQYAANFVVHELRQYGKLSYDPYSRYHYPDDAHYFESYDRAEIHSTMIKDKVRTEAYKTYIMDNSHLFKDKVVLDVGCGTGILSIFAVRFGGAKLVYAVDASQIINVAREVVFDNGLGDQVKCIHGKVEDMTLSDIPKVDIIISEWMGYCLLYEGMLDSVLFARDRFLKPDGIMLPSQASIYLAPVEDPAYSLENIAYWSNVHGLNMKANTKTMFHTAKIRTIEHENLISKPSSIFTADLRTVTHKDLEFTENFEFTLTKDIDLLTGYAVFFDVTFHVDGDNGALVLSTAPDQPVTHWEQAYLLINKDDVSLYESMKAGTVVSGNITFAKDRQNMREYVIKVKWSACVRENFIQQGTHKWDMK